MEAEAGAAEEGAASPGVRTAASSWGRPGNGFPGASIRLAALRPLHFWSPEQKGNECVVLSH